MPPTLQKAPVRNPKRATGSNGSLARLTITSGTMTERIVVSAPTNVELPDLVAAGGAINIRGGIGTFEPNSNYRLTNSRAEDALAEPRDLLKTFDRITALSTQTFDDRATPTANAILAAQLFAIGLLREGLKPAYLGASKNNGVGIAFRSPPRDAYFTAENDGDIWVSLVEVGKPTRIDRARDNTEVASLAKRTAQFLAAK